ncbi:MAG: hypothetical protein ACFBZ8_00780 [Opitutales bacterium]
MSSLLPVFIQACWVAVALLPLTFGLFLLFTSSERLLERFTSVVYGLTGHAGDYREVRTGKRVLTYLRSAGAVALIFGVSVMGYLVTTTG